VHSELLNLILLILFQNYVMKTTIFILSLILFSFSAGAQVAPSKYFVRFTDKNNSPYSINNPSEFLSQRAIDRRTNQGIPVDITDLPVNPSYLQGIAGTGAIILNPSKWLNGVSVYTDNASVIEAITDLPYVKSVSKSPQPLPGITPAPPTVKPFFKNEVYGETAGPGARQGSEIGTFDYGQGYNQIHMLNADALHDMGYRGQGKVIAILDGGFFHVNTLDAFDSLWQNNQILGTRDFVNGGEVNYEGATHGAMVLSCMGSNYPGELIGTAPKASFWLLVSEDVNSEYIIEEYNWVSAAEFADSVGADVINSSLGYTEFDNPVQNHAYANMDGNTCPSTIGADMAAKKGILVVNSLGNSGNDNWYYLSAPSDADSILGIGAVDMYGNYTSFSSHGPSYDGRVKPDVVAQGLWDYVVNPDQGGFTYGSGTSFSSPVLAGAATCLWQANPSLTNLQIADAIRRSASHYNSPTDTLGYGIPNFLLANNILTVVDGPAMENPALKIYPNPFSDGFIIEAGRHGGMGAGMNNGTIEISDITGRIILSQKVTSDDSGTIRIDGLNHAPKGMYFVKVDLNGELYQQKIVKD
jgi:serine protease AprX